MQNLSKFKNVDEADVKRFEGYSSHWWDPNGPTKLLHTLNKLRVPFICDGLVKTGLVQTDRVNKPDVLKGLKILDVGCGAGILAESLAQLGANVVGIDPSDVLLEVARNHLGGQSLNVEYICDVVEKHAANNVEKYHAVIASEVVEHVVDQKPFLDDCVKCLKPN